MNNKFANQTKVSIFFTLACLINGCSSSPGVVRGFKPEDPNPLIEKYARERGLVETNAEIGPNQAVIVIGVVGRYKPMNFRAKDRWLLKYSLFPLTEAEEEWTNETYSFPVSIGDSFTLTDITVVGNELKTLHAGNRMATWNAEINNAPTLKITKAGIYFYGTVYGNDSKIAYSKEVSQSLRENASFRYPQVFKSYNVVE
jgi:hypothetical protein